MTEGHTSGTNLGISPEEFEQYQVRIFQVSANKYESLWVKTAVKIEIQRKNFCFSANLSKSVQRSMLSWKRFEGWNKVRVQEEQKIQKPAKI
jgi:hypothetical protein